jgi:uncharacterized surface protein with fasciclin (FAS1) repeats
VPAAAQGGISYLRVANFSPDAPTLDLYIDGQKADIPPLQPAQLSNWLTIASGQHEVTFVESGSDPARAVVGPFTAAMDSDGYYLIPVIGAGSEIFAVLLQDTPPQAIPPGSAHVTAFNGMPGTAPQDVTQADGTVLFSGVEFGQMVNFDVPAGPYNMRMVDVGSTERGFRTGNVNLTEGVYYLLGLIRGRSSNGLILQQVLPQNAFPPTPLPSDTPQATSPATATFTESATPTETTTPTETATMTATATASTTPIPLPPTNTPRPLDGLPPATAIPLTPVVALPTTVPPTEPAAPTSVPPTATETPTLFPTATLTAEPPSATPTNEPPTSTPTIGPSATHAGPPDLVDVIFADPRLSITARAIQGVDLVDTLRRPGKLTIFAPTDQAWRNLLTEYPDILPNSDSIRNVMQYHVVTDEVPTIYIFDQMDLLTIQGGSLRFAKNGDRIAINNRARIIESDIHAANGILHIIDGVLIPPDMLPGSSNTAPQG